MRCRPTIFLCPPPPLQSKRRHGFAARPLLVAAPALCFWSLGVWVRLGTPRCERRSKNPSLEATEWFGCAGVKIRQLGSLSLIRARARDERRGALRESTTCGSD
jgi:hypothetical protein